MSNEMNATNSLGFQIYMSFVITLLMIVAVTIAILTHIDNAQTEIIQACTEQTK